MRQFRLAAALGMVAVLAFAVPANAGGTMSNRSVSDGGVATLPNVDTGTALVQLNGDPLSTYVKTKPAHGKKIDFGNTTVKSYRAQLSALRNDFKQWLQANAPKANVTGQFDISLNAVAVQLNGTTLGFLATAPQVKYVEYEGLYHPDPAPPADPDLALIHAVDAWNTGGGSSEAGAGIKVAIVDTGIDVTHPCFNDSGYDAQTQLGDHTWTNNKVIVAKVFNNKLNQSGFDASPVQEHGTMSPARSPATSTRQRPSTASPSRTTSRA